MTLEEKNNMIDDIFAKFDGAFAKNTIRAYRSDFMQYQTWCLENGLAPIPAAADTMSMYVDYLSENNKSATIRRRINSLSTVLKLSKHHETARGNIGHKTNAPQNWTGTAAGYSTHQTATEPAT